MTVRFAHDGKSGLRSALTGQHDLVLLCETLPELAGLQLTKQLRTHSDIGILMLSTHGANGDKIVALKCGADDYLDKPFRPRELIARIRAITRRVKPSFTSKFAPPAERFAIGDIVVDEGSRGCRHNGQIIDLTAAEFDLLIIFLRHSGRVIHRTDVVAAGPRPRVFSVRSKYRRLREQLAAQTGNSPRRHRAYPQCQEYRLIYAALCRNPVARQPSLYAATL